MKHKIKRSILALLACAMILSISCSHAEDLQTEDLTSTDITTDAETNAPVEDNATADEASDTPGGIDTTEPTEDSESISGEETNAPVEDNETTDVTTADATTSAPMQESTQLEDVAIIPPEVDTDEPKTEEIKTDVHKSVAPVEAYADYIDNWTGDENTVMKGYVLYALKLLETHSPEDELTDEQKDALLQMLSWATDDLTAQEAYEYYLNN